MKDLTAYIIAAGLGERLAGENCKYKKAMVPICGVPMIERLIKMIAETGFNNIRIITNENNKDVAEFIEEIAFDIDSCDVDIMLKSTPSSMHSLFELLNKQNSEQFFLFTVDTIFRKEQLDGYVSYCLDNQDNYNSIIAVTEFIDDEKPLYAKIEGDEITAFLDARGDCDKVTSGMYFFNEDVLPLLTKQIQDGNSKLRNFQRSLLRSGMSVGYYNFKKTIDLDHVDDIEKAEKFLKGE